MQNDFDLSYAQSLAGFTSSSALQWLNRNAFGRCLEIGTYGGRSAYAIASSPAVTNLLCIDTWNDYFNINGYPILAETDGFSSFMRLLKEKPMLPIKFQIKSSLDLKLLDRIQDNELDFLFVDGNHEYEHLCLELELWIEKVSSKGRIVVDDIDFPSVRKAVEEVAIRRKRFVKCVPRTKMVELQV